MVLIGSSIFVWAMYQLQAPADAKNMIAIALAISIALLTVSCYAILSKAYRDAGAGSSYYYAEAAILS
ncbi:MAG: hypothetical protein KME31_38390 [Tolypothrix carrinoi HA7290-LM1]|jgi:amino acid transporter|nr:hypothetical protein [Tolypothrix carrinoi HA7290-LM1]